MPARPAPDAARPLVFVHPSDELYGADRMLLEMVDAARADPRVSGLEVWLPTDLEHPAPELSLCGVLEQRGVTVRHLDVPVLRRAYRTPVGLARLLGRGVRLLARAAPRPRLDRLLHLERHAAGRAGRPAGPRAPGARARAGDLDPGRPGRPHRPRAGAAAGWSPSPARPPASLPAPCSARTAVVPNGTPDPGRPCRWRAGRGGLRFVVASRWNGWKGHRTLLAAWDAAQAPGRLTVLGGMPASGERTDVPALVAALPRPETVEVVGEVPDPSP